MTSWSFRPSPVWAALLATLLAIGAGLGQVLDPAEALVREERLRARFVDAMDRGTRPRSDSVAVAREFVLGARDLVDIGEDALPLLFDEIDRTDPNTFFLASYALGLLGGDNAREVLLAALERAEHDRSSFGTARKAWTCYSLALLGEVEAIRWVNRPPEPAGNMPLHELTSMIEGMAILLGERATPILLEELERLRGEPDAAVSAQFVINALGRTGDPAALPALHRVLLEDTNVKSRREAGRALSRLARRESLATLFAALTGDRNEYVRRAAALAIHEIGAPDRREDLIAAFGDEGAPGVRMQLLRSILPGLGEAGVPLVRDNWFRMRGIDRAEAISLLAPLGDDALPVVGRGLQSTNNKVQTAAIRALGTIGTPQARRILENVLRAPDWALTHQAAAELAFRGFHESVPSVAARLLEGELAQPITDPQLRDHVYRLFDVLLRMNPALDAQPFRDARERQPDPQLRAFLDERIGELELFSRNRDNPTRWLKTLQSAETVRVRNHAYRRLRELGGKAKVAVAVAARFDPAEDDLERRWILSTLSAFPGAETRELLERVLTAPEFSGYERTDLRAEAAWTARRIGDAEMRALLERAVRLREGLDTRVLVYWALLAGEEAVDAIAAYEVPRMRYPTWRSGIETEKLRKLARYLRDGRPVEAFDLPPDELKL